MDGSEKEAVVLARKHRLFTPHSSHSVTDYTAGQILGSELLASDNFHGSQVYIHKTSVGVTD